jgi:hypothetical protein
MEQGAAAIADFVERKCFFQVSDINGIILSDNDDMGFYLDYTSYETLTKDIPESMNVISYYSNESLFTQPVYTSNELIGVYSSPIEGAITDTLILYFFNEDSKAHFFEYNISLLNATFSITQETIVHKNLKQVSTNQYYEPSLDPDDYPYTRAVAAGSNLKVTIRLGEQTTNVFGCSGNIGGVKPILVIDYADYDIDIATGDKLSVYDSGSIIIGDYDSLSNLYSELGATYRQGAEFVKGVVNICYRGISI